LTHSKLSASWQGNTFCFVLLCCTLFRVSKDYYDSIHAASMYSSWKTLLQHRDPRVRAKMCNLIGNLCKHSPFFYVELERAQIFPSLIKCCNDTDRNTRKFACFAIGNAAFHTDLLYEALRPAIPFLVHLLSNDLEEKTRANAAGALGNLVRNSNSLHADLLHFEAVRCLISAIQTAPSSTQKTALFSLGNFCSYLEYKVQLEDGLSIVLAQLSLSDDAVVQKYLDRIKKIVEIAPTK